IRDKLVTGVQTCALPISGSGPLRAMGAARITYLATVATGWPGAFIEYQLINGAEAGCYVFYAEAVTPAPGLHVGEIVRAGQTIEIGRASCRERVQRWMVG